MDIVVLVLLAAMTVGIYRCTENNSLEKKVLSQKPFDVNGKEMVCGYTEKQNKVNQLEEEISKIRKNK